MPCHGLLYVCSSAVVSAFDLLWLTGFYVLCVMSLCVIIVQPMKSLDLYHCHEFIVRHDVQNLIY